MFLPTALLLLLLLTAADQWPAASGADILVIPGHANPSHVKSMYPVAEALARGGHRVVVWQLLDSNLTKTRGPESVHDEYLIAPSTVNGDQLGMPSEVMWSLKSNAFMAFFPWYMFTGVCKRVLDDDNSRAKFYQFVAQPWDVIIVDNLFCACGIIAAAEGAQRGIPVVDFGTSILMINAQEAHGNQLNSGLYAGVCLPEGVFDHRKFLQRLSNSAELFSWSVVAVALDYLMKFWMRNASFPRISDHYRNSDLAVASISTSLDFSKACVNDIVDLDVECPPKRPLPPDYRQLLEDPTSKGTIVMAMGHAVRWDRAPDRVTRAFAEVFARLTDYRIVWQFASDSPKPDVGRHVVLDSWIPQSALLYHNKTRLFISHMGGKSLREAICAGVPVVAMPMFAEQTRNTAAGIRVGIAVFLDKFNITMENVLARVEALLSNDTYHQNVEKLRLQLDDRIMPAQDLGRFWVEFLVRHGQKAFRKYLRMKRVNWLVFNDSYLLLASFILVFLMIFR